ncbi:AMP-binding protein [Alphaproteobacteria bacterium]|nr:AMP-binding protein [Alphaproteobacteria bacterium]
MQDVDKFYLDLLSKVSKESGPAYIYKETRVNYPNFLKLAERIHNRFMGNHNTHIVTIVDKGVLSYAAILAIILSGNTWVPLAPSSPTSRNIQAIKNFENVIIVTDRDLDEEFTKPETVKKLLTIDLRSISDLDQSLSFNPIGFDPDSNAMVYFTSGSTGEPKGVQITHHNYISMLQNIMGIVPWPDRGTFADIHELSFVISIPILFPCWLTRSAIVPALSRDEVFLPVSNLLENRVNVLITVPSTVSRIKAMKPNGVEELDLKVLINCGEPLHLDVLDYSIKLANGGEVFNFYGSTEVAPWTFYHHCNKTDPERFEPVGYAPIGKLVPGNKMHLDKETSELLVAGPQVTPGYLSEQEVSRFTILDGVRWYRTGDKVVQQNGLYFCKGRLDAQVKLNGYRVELMDIEAHLRTLPEVNGAVCLVSPVSDQGEMIVAVLHSYRKIQLAEVRGHLKSKLPTYMFPRKVFTISEVPFNKSGKIDRLAVKNMLSQTNSL